MDEDMAWVKFTDDFDYRPSEMNDRVVIAYKSGMEISVRRECADQAIAASKAAEIPAPARSDLPLAAVAHVDEPAVGG